MIFLFSYLNNSIANNEPLPTLTVVEYYSANLVVMTSAYLLLVLLEAADLGGAAHGL